MKALFNIINKIIIIVQRSKINYLKKSYIGIYFNIYNIVYVIKTFKLYNGKSII